MGGKRETYQALAVSVGQWQRAVSTGGGGSVAVSWQSTHTCVSRRTSLSARAVSVSLC